MDLKKNKNECKKCGHECHCLEELHTDIYGVCTCDTCECSDPKNAGEECLSCQQWRAPGWITDLQYY